MKEMDLAKQLSDILMFGGSSNVQLGSKLLKFHYPIFTVMRGVEHIVSLFSRMFIKYIFLRQINSTKKVIYNIFGYGIFRQPNSIFKSIPQDFHNKNWSFDNK